MTLDLNIAPVAFDQVDGDWLPGMQPFAYQWQAYRMAQSAFERNQTLCLFLVTPTGSGKTLASYAYSILTGMPALGVYPTNELIRDQERALAPEYRRVLGREDWVLRLDSRTLDEWDTNLVETRHAATLERLLSWRYPILTNPDVLFYILFGRYPDIKGQRQRLFSLLGSNYRLTVFDEFHLYNVKQMADVTFMIGALRAINPHTARVYIFASATPDLVIVPWLRDKLGIRTEIVTAASSQQPGARRIAQPVRLTIAPADLGRWQGSQTLVAHLPLVDAFYSQHGDARLVSIVEAVSGAITVARMFRQRYPHKGVGEVHGLSSDLEREKALRESITVGTSSIEVGIDFKDQTAKDVLILEAHTAGKFVQRFGRLARHAKTQSTPNWALALVPAYVYHFLRNRLSDDAPVSRQELGALIEEAYELPEDFSAYLHKHAPVEFYSAKQFIQTLFQHDVRPAVAAELERLILTLTGIRDGAAAIRYRQYLGQGILEPLMTFRSSNFQTAIWDARGVDTGFPAKQYNLMFMLRRGIGEELTLDEYRASLEGLAVAWPEHVSRELRHAKQIKLGPTELLGVYGFFLLSGLLDAGRKVWFEVESEEVAGRKAEVTVITGLQVVTEPHMRIKQLNTFLERKKIVAWFVDKHPAAIRFGRALPHLFELHELRVCRPGGATGSSWSIAFNQDAFFLDSLNWYSARKQSEAIIL